MKNFKKIISVLIISLLAFAPVTSAFLPGTSLTAEAAPVDGDNIIGFFEMLGIDIEELRGMSKEELTEKLREIFKFDALIPGGKTIAEIVREIMEYFGSFETPTIKQPEPTTEAPEETTAETTTAAPETTAPPAPVYPPYNPPPYNPPPYVPPATTVPEETTTFTYIPPEQIYTEVYTTTPFVPEVQEEESTKNSSPFKTILGVILLIGSFVAVVIVAVKLKKSNI